MSPGYQEMPSGYQEMPSGYRIEDGKPILVVPPTESNMANNQPPPQGRSFSPGRVAVRREARPRGADQPWPELLREGEEGAPPKQGLGIW